MNISVQIYIFLPIEPTTYLFRYPLPHCFPYNEFLTSKLKVHLSTLFTDFLWTLHFKQTSVLQSQIFIIFPGSGSKRKFNYKHFRWQVELYYMRLEIFRLLCLQLLLSVHFYWKSHSLVLNRSRNYFLQLANKLN